MLRVHIKTDLSGIGPEVNRMTKLGQYALANQAHADMNNYVPALDFDLRNQSYVTNDNKQIIYGVPYARRQFYTQFSNYTTPNTGPRWDLKAKSIHINSWIHITKQAMR